MCVYGLKKRHCFVECVCSVFFVGEEKGGRGRRRGGFFPGGEKDQELYLKKKNIKKRKICFLPKKAFLFFCSFVFLFFVVFFLLLFAECLCVFL